VTEPGERCSLAARGRGDSLLATALPVERFILIETPGPWVTGFWDAAALPAPVALHLRDAAIANHARLLLIRRPGRHPVADASQGRRWGVVSRDGISWGLWYSPGDLLKLDAVQEIARLRDSPGADGRPLVLVCTHGRKDVCCAIEGRPVAATLVRDPRIDVWECSHVGGDRFAANLLWLPSGLMFGGLQSSTVGAVAGAALDGRVVTGYFRGRCGDPAAAQAATHYLMEHLGENRPLSITVEPFTSGAPADPVELTAVHESVRYDMVLEPFWTDAHHLTCKAPKNARMRSYRLLELRPA
jgi:hypothetical protein